MLTPRVRASIVGFNGSKHCDHSSVSSFLSSYIRRKQAIAGASLKQTKHENDLDIIRDNLYEVEVLIGKLLAK